MIASKGHTVSKAGDKLVCSNKRARAEYEILETYEAGIALLGTEVKSLRDGRGNLQDSYAKVEGGEVNLLNFHIGPFAHAHQFNHEPLRKKKLLLHKSEIKRLIGKTTEKGLTLIPLKVYFTHGVAKVELGLAKGKKLYDRREDMRREESRKELERVLHQRMKRESY